VRRFIGDDKAFERRSYTLGNGMAKKAKKKLSMQSVNGNKKAKYSYGILEKTIQRFIQKHQLLKVLLVKFFTIM
jgi:hypothetical protein